MYGHDDDSVTVAFREPVLPDAFGALVEADVPHPHSSSRGAIVRTFLTRGASGDWCTREGWRFSDAYLSRVHVHHHGAPAQGAGITPAGELVTT
jgi:hypothetical protein